jgi:hypothetical protein
MILDIISPLTHHSSARQGYQIKIRRTTQPKSANVCLRKRLVFKFLRTKPNIQGVSKRALQL